MISGGFFIKRLAFFGILNILIFSILTCNIFEPYENEPDYPNNNDRSDYVYSQDGKYLTIYLDGNAPPPQSRAINRDIAISGHDYFEIAFLHPENGPNPDPANDVIARASWELREGAGVTGVYRTFAGVDYRYVSRADAINNAAGDGVADAGAAILFVGKKVDKTLLAVGRLIGVDNGNGLILEPAVGSTLITTATQSVTFLVDSLKSGVVYPTESSPGVWQSPSNSSFQTAARDNPTYTNVSPANTNVRPWTIGYAPNTRDFPAFRLEEGLSAVHAQYSFNVTSSLGFEYYRGGIILARQGHGPNGNYYEKKQPRYPISGQGFQGYSLRLDDRTIITSENNNGNVGAPVEHPLKFSFNTGGTINGSVFSLVFAVPINPLSADGNPGMWYLRPSYDSYLLDLDDGRSGTGGAVLIGTGDFDPPTGYRIRVVIPPLKFQYNSTLGRQFDINGLLVHMETINGSYIRVINWDELTFTVVGYSISVNPSTGLGDYIDSSVYGIQIVLVNYTDPYSGITYTDVFVILCDDNTHNFTNIPPEHFLVIPSPADDPNGYRFSRLTTWIQNMIADPLTGNPASGPNSASRSGTYVIIATSDVDFPDVAVLQEENGNVLIIILAGRPEAQPDPATPIIIGKSGNNAFTSWISNSSFYFGNWPFNAPITIGPGAWPKAVGEPIPVNGEYKTYDYILNAGGSFANVHPTVAPNPGDPPYYADTPPYPPNTANADGPTGNNMFLRNAQGGRIWDVSANQEWGVTVLNEEYLN
jgi:hypothetical protein